jgi:hypothetical protein
LAYVVPIPRNGQEKKMTNSLTLNGQDKRDLDKREWDLRSNNPRASIRKVHPDETLPLQMMPRRPGEKLLLVDRMSRRIEYDD